jgi:integrase
MQAKEKDWVASFRRAVQRGCEAAKVDRWTPNRLRHSRATELRKVVRHRITARPARSWSAQGSGYHPRIFVDPRGGISVRRGGDGSPVPAAQLPVAVRRACKRATEAERKAAEKAGRTEHRGIPVWRPNQLRHTAATRIRKAANVETARTALGHSDIRVTEIYAERDLEAAKAVIARIG